MWDKAEKKDQKIEKMMPKMIVSISFSGKLTRINMNCYVIFFNKNRPYLILVQFINEKKFRLVGYHIIVMSPSWNFPARAEPSYEGSEPSWDTLIFELKPS